MADRFYVILTYLSKMVSDFLYQLIYNYILGKECCFMGAASFWEFLEYSFVQIIMLAGIALIVFLNKKLKTPAITAIYIIICLTMCILVVNYISLWAEKDVSRINIRYWSSIAKYALNPFIAGIEVFALTEKQHLKILALLPAFINAAIIVVLPLISPVNIIIISELNIYHATAWVFLPYGVTAFYLVLLIFSTVKHFRRYKDKNIITVYFIVAASLLTMFLEYENIIINVTDMITITDIYLYYYYLLSVYQKRLHETAQQSRDELEKIKLKLLQEQMSPHFVYNALSIIQSLVWEDSRKASDVIDDFSSYLKYNVDSLRDTENLIPFERELEHIKSIQRIDEAGKGCSTNVIFDIRESSFRIPPLTAEPLFENAIKHGISGIKDGKICISSYSDENNYIVEIIDNGRGFASKEKSEGVGIDNIRTRLELLCGGRLSIESSSKGTKAVIYIPKNYKKSERMNTSEGHSLR